MERVNDRTVVRFDDHGIHLVAHASSGDAWEQRIGWGQITRVGFRLGGGPAPGDMFLSTATQPDGYRIPLAADGGQALWDAILDRGLFNRALADQAFESPDAFFCSPRRTLDGAVQSFPLYSPRQLPSLDGAGMTLTHMSIRSTDCWLHRWSRRWTHTS